MRSCKIPQWFFNIFCNSHLYSPLFLVIAICDNLQCWFQPFQNLELFLELKKIVEQPLVKELLQKLLIHRGVNVEADSLREKLANEIT
jgi:hypothetical protein